MNITNEDCMALMSRYADKHFDLAIVDPPYGIGKTWAKDRHTKGHYQKTKYLNNSIPDQAYFDELFRVSKNQIIWGYNYYAHLLPVTNNIIVWDKVLQYEKGLKSEGELAWSSIKKFPLLIYRHQWDGAKKGTENGKTKNIHPHQKPVQLYKWIINKFCFPGDKILDTHMGSGSIAIACHDYGYHLTACEIDEHNYNSSMKRISNHQKQIKIFE